MPFVTTDPFATILPVIKPRTSWAFTIRHPIKQLLFYRRTRRYRNQGSTARRKKYHRGNLMGARVAAVPHEPFKDPAVAPFPAFKANGIVEGTRHRHRKNDFRG
jgi:hypothetical protein